MEQALYGEGALELSAVDFVGVTTTVDWGTQVVPDHHGVIVRVEGHVAPSRGPQGGRNMEFSPAKCDAGREGKQLVDHPP